MEQALDLSFDRLLMMMMNPNISKLHSERNKQQQSAFGKCLLPFGPESSAMQFPTKKFKGTHYFIIYAHDVNLWGQSKHTVCFISPL